MSLSTAGCARLHLKAREEPPPSWDPKAACQFCPIGALNAGAPVAPLAEAAQSLARHCSRCEKPAARRINGLFCISCYNRDREARIGRNAKGNRPRLADQLYTQNVAVTVGVSVTVRAVSRVANRIEALALIAREATEILHFGIPPLSLDGP